MKQFSEAIEACLARAQAALEAEARERGVTVDEVQGERDRALAARDRMKALIRSGIMLPTDDLSRLAIDDLDRTEPLDFVQRWWRSHVDRPILIVCGKVDSGKTVAAGWAIGAAKTGEVVHAPELARRVSPHHFELELGSHPVRLNRSLLVLDDLGTESTGKARWSEAFALFVENRLMHGRTLITSNLTREEFRPRYGERIASRLNAHSYVVEVQSKASLRATGANL